MKCIVTGCAGFIGSSLSDRLLKEGHIVLGIDNLSTGQIRFMEKSSDNQRFNFVEMDLLNIEQLKKIFTGYDIVFHIAANADVRFGTENPKRDLEQNTIATFNVLEAMRLNNIKKIGNKKTDYYFIFRSRDSLLIKIIDNYLIPFELKIRKIINSSKEKSYNLVGDLKGFRRTEKEFITILKNNNFKIKAIHHDLFETEYNRLAIVRKLRLSKILSLLFLRSHPYLNIIKFKII